MSSSHVLPDPVPVEDEPGFRDLLAGLRPEALDIPRSGIEEIFAYGLGRQGLIPLYVGEGDLPTPAFIVDAAAASLRAGETFYTWQAGIPELRAAIARYMTRVHGTPFSPDRFFVTAGGMHALQIAIRMIAGTGDEILVPTPAWPNFSGAIAAAGARAVECPMVFEGRGDRGHWRLDLDLLSRAITRGTRGLVVNSPSNPTGWTATLEDLRALLELARRHGLWVLADEIYGRLVFEGERAPSFHDVMDPRDRVMFVQTFSKNWAMTGWRAGWLEAPPEFRGIIESLVQYSTSGVPVATQRAGIAALEHGEGVVADLIAQVRENRDLLCATLAANPRARFARPDGAFYLFCGLEGFADSRRLAFDLVDEAGIGVAPGSAFGAGGEGFVRMCFARKREDIVDVAHRLERWLAR